MTYHDRFDIQAGQGLGTNLEGTLLDEPPGTIDGPFEFTAEITNNGSGKNWDIDAVLSNQDTGNNYTITRLTAQFIGEGETIEADYIISQVELADVPSGNYTLRILMEPTLEEGARVEVIGKSVTVTGSASGGGGGVGGGGSNGGSPGLGVGGDTTKALLVVGGGALVGIGVAKYAFSDNE